MRPGSSRISARGSGLTVMTLTWGTGAGDAAAEVGSSHPARTGATASSTIIGANSFRTGISIVSISKFQIVG
jgi:hypothetical protein